MMISKAVDTKATNIAAGGAQCELCGSTTFGNFLKTDEYCLVRCQDCDVVFLAPQPPKPEVREMSSALYGSDGYKDMYFDSEHKLRKRYARFFKEIGKYKKSGRLLDIGCSYGFFLDAAKDSWETYGLEPCKRSADFAQSNFGLKVTTGPIDGAVFPSDYFDVITMWDMLEHVSSPRNTLKEASRMLKKNGILFLQCPNIDSLMARVARYKAWTWLCLPDHLFHFSPSALASLLEKSDFRIIKISTWEPLDEFLDSLFALLHPPLSLSAPTRRAHLAFLLTRAVRKLLVCVLAPLIWPIRQLWWEQGKGGLIQVYACKKTV
jgi:SAM-dependent methyltransferase